MASKGKRVKALKESIDRSQRYALADAIGLVKKGATAKFDESVDVAVRLGVNPRHADQMVRGACVLPHGTGKTIRVLVFAKGDKATEAEEAGADFVGADDLVDKIKEGWLEFDRAIATPDMMGLVGRVGRILGPRGLMPNPKVGTVTFEVGTAVQEARAGKIDFRVEKAGIVHAPVGRASFDGEQLVDNVKALVDMLIKLKPASAKGAYVRSMWVSSTMGPSIPVDHIALQAELRTT